MLHVQYLPGWVYIDTGYVYYLNSYAYAQIDAVYHKMAGLAWLFPGFSPYKLGISVRDLL